MNIIVFVLPTMATFDIFTNHYKFIEVTQKPKKGFYLIHVV